MAGVELWQVLVGLGIWIAVLAPLVITTMKGQWVLLIAGFVTVGFVWLIAACRLAKPGSYWARRYYGPEKLARSRARYGEG
jgi:hypothetical protein